MGSMLKYYHDEQIKERQSRAASPSPENPPL
jgi:hypothetical protein